MKFLSFKVGGVLVDLFIEGFDVFFVVLLHLFNLFVQLTEFLNVLVDGLPVFVHLPLHLLVFEVELVFKSFVFLFTAIKQVSLNVTSFITVEL